LPVVIGISAVGLALADGLRALGVQAVVSVVVLAVAAMVALNGRQGPRRLGDPGSYEPRTARRLMPPVSVTMFVLWALGSFLLHPMTTEGIQNIVVILAFFCAIPAAASATTVSTPPRVLRAFRNAGLVLGAFYLVLVVRYGPGVDHIVSARAVGGSLLACVAVAVARAAVLKRSRLPVLFMVFATALSLSRAATAIAVIVLMTFAIRGMRSTVVFRIIGLGGVLVIAVGYTYNHYSAFRDRFTQGDGYEVRGFTVGSSGRSKLWSAVYQHWQERPWTGFGPGNAERFTTEHFVTINHPHNDYLRLLNDYGALGTAMFAVGMLALLTAAIRRYKASSGVDQAVHLAAVVATVAALLFMIANNPLVGIFGMLALGGLHGVSLARAPEVAGDTNADRPVGAAWLGNGTPLALDEGTSSDRQRRPVLVEEVTRRASE
jgi:O-antigen ligase